MAGGDRAPGARRASCWVGVVSEWVWCVRCRARYLSCGCCLVRNPDGTSDVESFVKAFRLSIDPLLIDRETPLMVAGANRPARSETNVVTAYGLMNSDAATVRLSLT